MHVSFLGKSGQVLLQFDLAFAEKKLNRPSVRDITEPVVLNDRVSSRMAPYHFGMLTVGPMVNIFTCSWRIRFSFVNEETRRELKSY